MFGYCGVTSTSSRARGSAATTSSAVRAQQRDVAVEQVVVEVAHDRADLGPAADACDLVEVDEAVAAGGASRASAVGGQRGEDPRRPAARR